MSKKLTLQEKTTIDYYDKYAKKWSEKHGLGGSKSPMFQQEMELLFKLVPQGKILEVGTGHGGDALFLIKHYGVGNYVGVDAAEGLLTIARQRNPKADIQLSTIYDLDFPKEYFDGFWISAILIHVPKNKLGGALESVRQVIKTGGIGFISVMEGEADMEESRQGRHYSLWQSKEFESELTSNRYEIIHKGRIETDASPWLTFLVRKIQL